MCNLCYNTNLSHYDVVFIVIIIKGTVLCLRSVLNRFRMILIIAIIHFFFLWRCDPSRVMASFLMFLDHTQWRTTVGRTSLYEWSARRRDLYLTTQHSQQTNIHAPQLDSNPESQQASGRRLRLRPCGHWDRQRLFIYMLKWQYNADWKYQRSFP